MFCHSPLTDGNKHAMSKKSSRFYFATTRKYIPLRPPGTGTPPSGRAVFGRKARSSAKQEHCKSKLGPAAENFTEHTSMAEGIYKDPPP